MDRPVLDAGSAVVIATHEIEPFAAKASPSHHRQTGEVPAVSAASGAGRRKIALLESLSGNPETSSDL